MKRYILAIAAFMALGVTACSEPQEADAPLVTPEIEISAGEVGQGSLMFNIELKDAAEAGYMLVEKASAEASDFATNNVVKNSVLLEEAESQEVKIDGLKENTDYQVIAYCKAKGNDTPAVSDVITMRTKGLQLQMGFFAYDGIDEASGRHRVTFMGSTRPRGSDMTDYLDVTLFMYLLYDPGDYPTAGNYEIFQEDGSNMNTNLVYKAGKHVLMDGEPNMQGSGWWLIEDGKEDVCNASMTGVQTILHDEDTHVTTITGTMIDSETGKTLNYTYSTEEPLFRFNDY